MMRRRYCTAWTALAILSSIALLTALVVHAAAPATDAGAIAPQFASDFGKAHATPSAAAQAAPPNAPGAPATQPGTFGNSPDVTDEQIGAAITHGADFLLSNFNKFELKHLDGEANEIDHDGLNALCVYALLQAGQATHDPRLNINEPFMKGAIDQMKRQKLVNTAETVAPVTYSRSIRAAALAVYNRPEDKQALRGDVDWLLHAHRDGAYTYDDHFGTPTQVVDPTPVVSPAPVMVVPGPAASGGAGGGVKPTPAKSPPGKPSLAPSPLPPLGPSRLPPLNPSPLPPLGPSRLPPLGPSNYGPGRDRCVPSRPGAVTRPSSANPNDPNRTSTDVTEVRRFTPSQPRDVADSFPWDNSNSQFGLLGVWAAAEAGIEIPKDYWEAVEGHWLRDEQENGQWGYNDFHATPSYSMTCAGIASLLVTHDWLGPIQKPGSITWPGYGRGLEQALLWLMTSDNSVNFKDTDTYYVGYNLFTAERVGLASGSKYFGSHDWYREMSAAVIPVQWPNGAFGRSPEGYDAVVQTAFTMLFLSRGRHPIFMEKLWFPGRWANRPRDLANVTRFASHELERTLNWQIVPVEHDWTDWLDSPVLFIASDQPPVLSDAAVDKLRAYAHSGGMLFTHADGGDSAFDQYVERNLSRKLFPQYEMYDVPANDPIYTIQYHLKAPLPKLRGISNGSRWLLVHSPDDITTNWQTRMDKNAVARTSFELAVNLFVYAAGKSDLRNRLASPYIPEPSQTPDKTIDVARLSYGGNWDPEPYAWVRFDRWMQTNADRKLNVQTSAIADLKPHTAPLAVLTGTADATPTDAEIAALKAFVEAGGWLLIDDCGGSGKFASAIETNWLPKLTNEKFAPIPISDRLICGGGPYNLDDLTKPRYREGTTERLGASYKPLWVSIGKGKIIYSPIDITSGLLGANTSGILGYKPQSAMSFAKNVVIASYNP